MVTLLLALVLYPLPVAKLQAKPRQAGASESQMLERFTSACKGIESEEVSASNKHSRWGTLLDTVAQAAIAKVSSNPAITSAALQSSLSPFSKVLNRLRKPDSDIHLELSVQYTTHAELSAVAITIGHVSTLKVISWHSKKQLFVPASLDWLVDYSELPFWATDGSLVVTCNSIQDIGNRTGCKLFACQVVGNQCLQRSVITREQSLDFGSVRTAGNTVEIESLDAPHSFTISAATSLLRKRETFHVNHGNLMLARTRLSDNEIRAVDRWMAEARRSVHKTKQQTEFAKKINDSGMLLNYHISNGKSGVKHVRINLDGVPLEFRIMRHAATNAVEWIH
jgi:hypothetical protein